MLDYFLQTEGFSNSNRNENRLIERLTKQPIFFKDIKDSIEITDTKQNNVNYKYNSFTLYIIFNYKIIVLNIIDDYLKKYKS